MIKYFTLIIFLVITNAAYAADDLSSARNLFSVAKPITVASDVRNLLSNKVFSCSIWRYLDGSLADKLFGSQEVKKYNRAFKDTASVVYETNGGKNIFSYDLNGELFTIAPAGDGTTSTVGLQISSFVRANDTGEILFEHLGNSNEKSISSNGAHSVAAYSVCTFKESIER